MTRDDMMGLVGATGFMADGIERAIFAQLEDGEDLDAIDPARGATLATRAALLSAIPIDWAEEVDRYRKFNPDFLRAFALTLATGELVAVQTLRKLNPYEAELVCRVTGQFLGEVIRQIDDQDEQLAEIGAAHPPTNRPGDGSPDASTEAPPTHRPEGPG